MLASYAYLSAGDGQRRNTDQTTPSEITVLRENEMFTEYLTNPFDLLVVLHGDQLAHHPECKQALSNCSRIVRLSAHFSISSAAVLRFSYSLSVSVFTSVVDSGW